MSDGSDRIQVRDPQTFDRLSSFQVTHPDVPSSLLNELEYAEGYLYANVWYEDVILKIDPSDGQVVTIYDIKPILDQADLSESQLAAMDSLNGIAHIQGEEFLISGKYYPYIFQVKLK